MYYVCNVCGKQATAHVTELGGGEVHLCEPCLRGTVSEAASVPPRPQTVGDRFVDACGEIRAEELRAPTSEEIRNILDSLGWKKPAA